MTGDTKEDIPESGAIFTFGKSKFCDNVPSRFWLKNDQPELVSCGDEHTALVTAKGKLFMFGSNNWGQLGLDTKTTVNRPTCVKALKSEKVKLVACGRNHTLLYTFWGDVYAAGGNSEGQLGLGDNRSRTSFQPLHCFSGQRPVVKLAAGSGTSAALMDDGRLFMWGDNTEGQLGLGNVDHVLRPQEVTVGRRVSWVSCGYHHSAIVTVDGDLYTFGECDGGKLGLSEGQLGNHRIPQLVKGMPGRVRQVACGGAHTVVLTEDDLYSFGLGQFGQLGHGTFIFESPLPKQMGKFCKGRICSVTCGENHTAVITESGLLYTFGDGRHGKLGLGDENFANQFMPARCDRFVKCYVQSVSCGGCHMLVLAKPRPNHLSDALLIENLMVDSYTGFLQGSSTLPLFPKHLSARVRRREREKSQEESRWMFHTLPAVTHGPLLLPKPSPPERLDDTNVSRNYSAFELLKVMDDKKAPDVMNRKTKVGRKSDKVEEHKEGVPTVRPASLRRKNQSKRLTLEANTLSEVQTMSKEAKRKSAAREKQLTTVGHRGRSTDIKTENKAMVQCKATPLKSEAVGLNGTPLRPVESKPKQTITPMKRESVVKGTVERKTKLVQVKGESNEKIKNQHLKGRSKPAEKNCESTDNSAAANTEMNGESNKTTQQHSVSSKKMKHGGSVQRFPDLQTLQPNLSEIKTDLSQTKQENILVSDGPKKRGSSKNKSATEQELQHSDNIIQVLSSLPECSTQLVTNLDTDDQNSFANNKKEIQDKSERLIKQKSSAKPFQGAFTDSSIFEPESNKHEYEMCSVSQDKEDGNTGLQTTCSGDLSDSEDTMDNSSTKGPRKEGVGDKEECEDECETIGSDEEDDEDSKKPDMEKDEVSLENEGRDEEQITFEGKQEPEDSLEESEGDEEEISENDKNECKSRKESEKEDSEDDSEGTESCVEEENERDQSKNGNIDMSHIDDSEEESEEHEEDSDQEKESDVDNEGNDTGEGKSSSSQDENEISEEGDVSSDEVDNKLETNSEDGEEEQEEEEEHEDERSVEEEGDEEESCLGNEEDEEENEAGEDEAETQSEEEESNEDEEESTGQDESEMAVQDEEGEVEDDENESDSENTENESDNEDESKEEQDKSEEEQEDNSQVEGEEELDGEEEDDVGLQDKKEEDDTEEEDEEEEESIASKKHESVKSSTKEIKHQKSKTELSQKKKFPRARADQSSGEDDSTGSQKFWGNVLPQYLNLK